MRSTTWSKGIVVKGIIMAIAAQSGLVFADAPVPKWYDTIGLSGYLQSSYVGNLEDSTLNTGNQGRQFDTNGNSFSLNTFLLQIAKPVGDSDHYGFTVRLRTGADAADLPGSKGDLEVQEAYMTYAATSKLQVIGGRFVTPEGFEGVDTVNNPNFSEGLLFTLVEPISHTGLKLNYTFNDKVNTTFGVVNGWNDPTDNNSSKTLLWQVATTPTKQTSWSFQGLYGKELSDPSHAQRLSLDTVGGYNPTDKLSLNVQGNWGEQTSDPGTTASAGTTHWLAAGIWASYATTSKFTETARFEVVSDQNGANAAEGFNQTGGAVGAPVASGFVGPQTIKEFTLTHKTMLTANMGTRLEYRHDWSNEAYFLRSTGGDVRNQNTISADWFVTF
jgi:hypothetical protein